MCWMAAVWSRSVGFIGARVMRELVLDFSGPELGTERRFWQAADLCVYLCVCSLQNYSFHRAFRGCQALDDSLAHGLGKLL